MTSPPALPEFAAARFEAAIRKAEASRPVTYDSSLAVSAITLLRDQIVCGLASGSVVLPLTALDSESSRAVAAGSVQGAAAGASAHPNSAILSISSPLLHLGAASVRHMQPLPCGGLVAALFSGQVFRVPGTEFDRRTAVSSEPVLASDASGVPFRSHVRRSASADSGSLSDAASRLVGELGPPAVMSRLAGAAMQTADTMQPSLSAIGSSGSRGVGRALPSQVAPSRSSHDRPWSGHLHAASDAEAIVRPPEQLSEGVFELSDGAEGSAFAVSVLTPLWRNKPDSAPAPTLSDIDPNDVLVATGRGDGSIDVRSLVKGDTVHRLFAHKMTVIDLATTPYEFCGAAPGLSQLGLQISSPPVACPPDCSAAPQRVITGLLSPPAQGGVADTFVPKACDSATCTASLVAAAPASAVPSEDEGTEDENDEEEGSDDAAAGAASSASSSSSTRRRRRRIPAHAQAHREVLPPPRSLAPHSRTRQRARSHDRSDVLMMRRAGAFTGWQSAGVRQGWSSSGSSRPPLSFGEDSAFKPPTLLSVGRDGTLRSWDVVSGKQKATAHHGAPVWTLVAYGPRVYTGGADGRIRVWSARSGRAVASFHVQRQVVCIAVVGETVLAGTNNGNLVCIDAVNGDQLWVMKLFRDRCAVRRLVLDCAAHRILAVSQFGSLASIDLAH